MRDAMLFLTMIGAILVLVAVFVVGMTYLTFALWGCDYECKVDRAIAGYYDCIDAGISPEHCVIIVGSPVWEMNDDK